MFSRPLSKQAKLEYLYQKVHWSTAAEYRFSTFSEEGGYRVLEKSPDLHLLLASWDDKSEER